jgi:hypothetical protein
MLGQLVRAEINLVSGSMAMHALSIFDNANDSSGFAVHVMASTYAWTVCFSVECYLSPSWPGSRKVWVWPLADISK